MRISKGEYSAEIEKINPEDSPVSRFRYVLYHLANGETERLFASRFYRGMKNCVARADQHLDRMAKRRTLLIGVLGPYIAQQGRIAVVARRSTTTMPKRRADSSAA
jgi:hypothetical protein